MNHCETCRRYDGTCTNAAKLTYDSVCGRETDYLSPGNDGLVVRVCSTAIQPAFVPGPKFGCVHHEAKA